MDSSFDDMNDGDEWKDGGDSHITPPEFAGKPFIPLHKMTSEQKEEHSRTVYSAMEIELQPKEIKTVGVLHIEDVPLEVWYVLEENQYKAYDMFNATKKNALPHMHIMFYHFAVLIVFI